MSLELGKMILDALQPHDVDVVISTFGRYRATCTCGWFGSSTVERATALYDADRHQTPKVAPKTPEDHPDLPEKSASYAVLGVAPKHGDHIVVTSGEQAGWRGTVFEDYAGIPASVRCLMTRPNGTKVGSVVSHRTHFVEKVLDVVPIFASLDDAEAWLTANDREVRPVHVVGEMIRFRRTSLDGWVELEGKVVAFVPNMALASLGPGTTVLGPGYRVLTTLPSDEQPHVIDVPAGQIIE